ncbi:putative mechanosensitive ion channel MscS, LSM domain-containing protein [Medicago truncatula]|uniref:Mechanosensitive ion channel protein MscS n=1 Tax=Medicago truncatula TaxID=3880 RepID=A0A072TNQ4_MEDTR|nr:mechanosensitive ion channel protein 1, mitochondrial [Medicago truncatula]KEH18821.1 mechanosensitive ion channel protein MscS [Medicago truncatula]RHN39859.1 putative mechanosensitive ion channel MscS, LSM domain-containing protein [Medicago truncatula]
MSAIRFSHVKSLHSSIKGFSNFNVQNYHSNPNGSLNLARISSFCTDFSSRGYSKNGFKSPKMFAETEFRNLGSLSGHRGFKFNAAFETQGFSSPRVCFSVVNIPFASNSMMTNGLSSRMYSSGLGGEGSKNGETEVGVGTGVSDVKGGGGGDSFVSGDLVDRMKDTWKSVVEAVSYAGDKVKEGSDGVTPYAQQFLDSHPYLNMVVVPVGGTLTATLVAWFILPRILRKFHKYGMQSPVSLFQVSLSGEPVPYEKSFWGAMEDPVRYLVTFLAFSQIAAMVAPTAIASQYLVPTWRGAVILSFVWFLHRWKTNVFARTLTSQSVLGLDREKMLALDKISSIGLFVIGIMALAEACGVAVQSIVTVGGVGGVATAFAARDVLGNVFSGLSMQFSKPFSIGDTIKAGSIEGQVVEIGLTSTSLLSPEKFPIIVPNSFFSSQVIVNKSRAEYRAILTKIPLQTEDFSKIPHIANDVKGMLTSNAKVFLEKDVPCCFLSRIESKYAELTLGYNLKNMRKDELYSAEQDILLQAVQIIKNHGVALGSTWNDTK